MSENKRFTNNDNNDFNDSLIDCSFTDNLTKKIYFITEWDSIVGLCNTLWNQTQRFEKHNQRLTKENEQLKQRIKVLKKENKELKAFKEQVRDEIQDRYDLSNHKPVFMFMAKNLGLELFE